MRFGISATSLIVPKNFLTRLRPVNVCAIVSLSIRFGRATRAPLRTVAIHRDHQDRRRGCPYLCDSGSARTAAHFTPSREWVSAHALLNNIVTVGRSLFLVSDSPGATQGGYREYLT